MTIFTDTMMALLPLAEKWAGVDETVVGKFAQEAGRPPDPGWFDGMGDLPLLLFLLAGAIAGFVLGYFYRDFLANPNHHEKGDDDAV